VATLSYSLLLAGPAPIDPPLATLTDPRSTFGAGALRSLFEREKNQLVIGIVWQWL
jgi:hypothetical protein